MAEAQSTVTVVPASIVPETIWLVDAEGVTKFLMALDFSYRILR